MVMGSKKDFLLLSLFFLFFLELSAQVGIGTTNPDASSALDVYSDDKGVLLPRVTLASTADATIISNPATATSLLVYNISAINDVTPGFYYWNGIDRWNRINNDIEKVYGEIYNDPNTGQTSRQTMDPTQPIRFHVAGEIQGVIAVPTVLPTPVAFQGFEIITSGIYRVSYYISIEMWVSSGTTPLPDPENVGFYLTTGLVNPIAIPGSFCYTQVVNTADGNCSMSKIIYLTAGDSIRLFTDSLFTHVYVKKNTATMNIELIKAD